MGLGTAVQDVKYAIGLTKTEQQEAAAGAQAGRQGGGEGKASWWRAEHVCRC